MIVEEAGDPLAIADLVERGPVDENLLLIQERQQVRDRIPSQTVMIPHAPGEPGSQARVGYGLGRSPFSLRSDTTAGEPLTAFRQEVRPFVEEGEPATHGC